LSRSVNSIAEVWEEYCNGIDGGPSIKDLEIAYGREWRVDPGESRFFSRRKTIYREIRRLAGIYNISCEDAVRKLEKQRERMRKSVDDM
ncbi:transcriptional activator of glycolytic enzymes-domain-containing protein, partial [Sporodiniella umbellata]